MLPRRPADATRRYTAPEGDSGVVERLKFPDADQPAATQTIKGEKLLPLTALFPIDGDPERNDVVSSLQTLGDGRRPLLTTASTCRDITLSRGEAP